MKVQQNLVVMGLANQQILNAAKMFRWRACQNLLPTKENRMKRGIVTESFCPICEIDSESVTLLISYGVVLHRGMR